MRALSRSTFTAAAEEFSRSELRRKRYVVSVIPGLTNIEFAIASPEDTILAKLVWFRKGGGTSDRQWHDILGVLRVQKASLEHDYLRHWALQLGVEALFDKAKSDLRAAIRSCIAGAAHLLGTV